MNQTRLESLAETLINTALGFAVSYFAWPVAAWWFNIPYNHGSHLGVVAFFTVLSIARGYVVRRFFNRRIHAIAVKLAARVAHAHFRPWRP